MRIAGGRLSSAGVGFPRSEKTVHARLNPTLAEEIGSALMQLCGEAKVSILLFEQALDFCKELADTVAIMDRGAVGDLTDAAVKKYLTV